MQGKAVVLWHTQCQMSVCPPVAAIRSGLAAMRSRKAAKMCWCTCVGSISAIGLRDVQTHGAALPRCARGSLVASPTRTHARSQFAMHRWIVCGIMFFRSNRCVRYETDGQNSSTRTSRNARKDIAKTDINEDRQPFDASSKKALNRSVQGGPLAYNHATYIERRTHSVV